jgi:hypothetical protein
LVRTIQSWLYLVPSENVPSATVWDCFKITGAIDDEGGGPTWTDDASYNAPNTITTGGVAAAAKECSAKEPAGAAILVPPPEPGQYGFATYTGYAGGHRRHGDRNLKHLRRPHAIGQRARHHHQLRRHRQHDCCNFLLVAATRTGSARARAGPPSSGSNGNAEAEGPFLQRRGGPWAGGATRAAPA